MNRVQVGSLLLGLCLLAHAMADEENTTDPFTETFTGSIYKTLGATFSWQSGQEVRACRAEGPINTHYYEVLAGTWWETREKRGGAAPNLWCALALPVDVFRGMSAESKAAFESDLSELLINRRAFSKHFCPPRNRRHVVSCFTMEDSQFRQQPTGYVHQLKKTMKSCVDLNKQPCAFAAAFSGNQQEVDGEQRTMNLIELPDYVGWVLGENARTTQ